MNGDFDDISSPVRLEDDQELWQLLGHAKSSQVSPYFARRVLRETAAEAQSHPSSALWRGLLTWWQAGLPLLRPPRAAAWSGAFAAVVICAVTVLTTFSNGNDNLRLRPVVPAWQPTDTPAVSPAPGNGVVEAALAADRAVASAPTAEAAGESTITPQDAEVIADLDTLMAREETHLWTDDNSAE